MNITLIIVGLILVAGAYIGYKNGLIKIAASLLATLIIILLVGMITPYVSQWIRETTPLEATIQKKMTKMLVEKTEIESEEVLLDDEIPREQQISALEDAELPKVLREMLLENNNDEVYELLKVETFGEYVGSYIAKVVADIIAFLITMLIVIIIVRIAVGVLGILDKLPVIGGMNRLVGGIVGIGVGFMVVWILLIVVTLMYDTAVGKTCFENIEASPILTSLYEGNLLMKYIIKF